MFSLRDANAITAVKRPAAGFLVVLGPVAARLCPFDPGEGLTDGREKQQPIGLELRVSQAGTAEQARGVRRPVPGNGPQGLVPEDDVWRHATRLRDAPARLAENLEETLLGRSLQRRSGGVQGCQLLLLRRAPSRALRAQEVFLPLQEQASPGREPVSRGTPFSAHQASGRLQGSREVQPPSPVVVGAEAFPGAHRGGQNLSRLLLQVFPLHIAGAHVAARASRVLSSGRRAAEACQRMVREAGRHSFSGIDPSPPSRHHSFTQ